MAALDPRTKNLSTFSEDDKKLIWESVKRRLLADEQSERAHAEIDELPDVSPQSVVAVGEKRGRESHHNFSNTTAAAVEDISLEISSELAVYKAEPAVSVQNPLVWWHSKVTVYPHMSRLARKILAIPATSASSERLFSVASLTVCNSRALLSADRTEELCFVKPIGMH